MSQSKFYSYLDQDGSIVLPSERLLTLVYPFQLRLILTSRLTEQLTPVLVTSVVCQGHTRKLLAQLATVSEFPLKKDVSKVTVPFHITPDGDFVWVLNSPNRNGSHYLRVFWVDQCQQIVRAGRTQYFVVSSVQIRQYSLQTNLPYSLGPIERWEQQLLSQIQLGYTAFHFCPLEQAGSSRSPYSIADQLSPNQIVFHNGQWDMLHDVFTSIRQKCPKVLFFVDIVLNHTSFDSEWLNEPQYAQAIYNEQTVPHLASAKRLDDALLDFSFKFSKSEIKEYPKGNLIENYEDVDIVAELVWKKCIQPLGNYFEFDADKTLNQLRKELKLQNIAFIEEDHDLIDEDNLFATSPVQTISNLIVANVINLGAIRKGIELNQEVLVSFFRTHLSKVSMETFSKALKLAQAEIYKKGQNYLFEALENIKKILIERVKSQKYIVDKNEELFKRQFSSRKDGWYAANNGWVLDADPDLDICSSNEFNYLRRRVYVWGDCIKLRFGPSKESCPALWKRMKQYVQQAARNFDGFRIDNAHSTPLHVAQKMIASARKINPKLLIFAEYFGGSLEQDTKFASMVGVDAFVKEIVKCQTPESLSSSLRWFSGNNENSIGALPDLVHPSLNELQLRGHMPVALKYDQSHDNKSIENIYGYKQVLPFVSLLAFTKVFKGSVRGVDEYYPEKISVFDDRLYKYLDPPKSEQIDQIQIKTRITYELQQPNNHVQLMGSHNNWQQPQIMQLVSSGQYAYVDLFLPPGKYEYKFIENGVWRNDSLAITNKNTNHDLIVQHEKYEKVSDLRYVRKILNELQEKIEIEYPQIDVENIGQSIIMITRSRMDYQEFKVLITQMKFKYQDELNQAVQIKLPGLLSKVDYIFENTDEYQQIFHQKELQGQSHPITIHKNLQSFGQCVDKSDGTLLRLCNLPQSCTIILTCVPAPVYSQALELLNQSFSQPLPVMDLTHEELNFLYFQTRDECNNQLYVIPNCGVFPYAGLMGAYYWVREAQNIRSTDHPLFQNMKQGNWLVDFLKNRVMKYKSSDNFKLVQERVNKDFSALTQLPKFSIPCEFLKLLQHYIHSLSLVPIVKNLPKIESELVEELRHSLVKFQPEKLSRWTLIGFRGFFLRNKQYQVAKEVLKKFARHLRHGLIPAEINDGQCRFNSRDNCWWWIKAVKEYLEITNDNNILTEEIELVYLDDDEIIHQQKKGQTLKSNISSIIQIIFQCHAQGIKFQEWKAGYQLDPNMEKEGFTISLQVNQNTGIIFGGNTKNALTWMNKIGSSWQNQYVPSSSRDGAPIECTALLFVCLEFIHKLYKLKLHPFEGVNVQGRQYSFKQWSDGIILSFERCYWIPLETQRLIDFCSIEPQFIKRKGIYKDTFKSSKLRKDLELRPNACIAIALAPELFQIKQHAVHYLAVVESVLIDSNSIGIKTLDKLSSDYYPNYDEDDETSPKSARGFSKYNGPEWTWLMSYFILALQKVHNCDKYILMSYLANMKRAARKSSFFAIPTQCNANGEINTLSYENQAWTNALLIDTIFELNKK